MKSDVRIGGQPVTYFSGEVRAKVVHDDVKLPISVLSLDRLHKREKLLCSASTVAFPGDLTRRDVQRPEQVDRAMSDVVVRSFLRFIERHGKQRLGTV